MKPSADLWHKFAHKEQDPTLGKMSNVLTKELIAMKPSRSPYQPKASSIPEPALNVVVYRNPVPDERVIATHAQATVRTQASCGTGLAYITLVASDFDRLWDAVDRTDALGTAYSVLPFLGHGAVQFIGRHADFVFGWIGRTDERYGNVLLLQIISRLHLLAVMN